MFLCIIVNAFEEYEKFEEITHHEYDLGLSAFDLGLSAFDPGLSVFDLGLSVFDPGLSVFFI